LADGLFVQAFLFFAEQHVIAKLDGVGAEVAEFLEIWRQCDVVVGGQIEEFGELMRARILDTGVAKDGFEQLLILGGISVNCKSLTYRLPLRRFFQVQRSEPAGLR